MSAPDSLFRTTEPLRSDGDPATVRSVIRACDVLRAFRFEGEVLRLRDIVARTALRKTTAHRLLRSLLAGGVLQRVGEESYVSLLQPLRETKPRIAMASQSEEYSFSRAVTAGVRRAAGQAGVDLVCVDNQYSIRAAIRNAQMLVRERVDLVFEFQTHVEAAGQVAAVFAAHQVPVIAIEIPMPGATYFGVDNYEAGRLLGNFAGRWLAEHWESAAGGIVLLEEPSAGPVPCSRLDAFLVGVRKFLKNQEGVPVTVLNGKGSFGSAFQAVRRFLKYAPRRRYLIAGNNDPSTLGALRAFEEAGWSQDCVAASFGGVREGRAELRRKNSRLLATVAFFPERYGDGLLALALDVLGGKKIPACIYTKIELLTPSNVDLHYRSDLGEL